MAAISTEKRLPSIRTVAIFYGLPHWYTIFEHTKTPKKLNFLILCDFSSDEKQILADLGILCDFDLQAEYGPCIGM